MHSMLVFVAAVLLGALPGLAIHFREVPASLRGLPALVEEAQLSLHQLVEDDQGNFTLALNEFVGILTLFFVLGASLSFALYTAHRVLKTKFAPQVDYLSEAYSTI